VPGSGVDPGYPRCAPINVSAPDPRGAVSAKKEGSQSVPNRCSNPTRVLVPLLSGPEALLGRGDADAALRARERPQPDQPRARRVTYAVNPYSSTGAARTSPFEAPTFTSCVPTSTLKTR
jgi:hypothetical protein